MATPQISTPVFPMTLLLQKKLLAEAGYGDGFDITLNCPNDRYVNDEAICTAVVGMLGKVGVKVNLFAQTKSTHFQDLKNGLSDFYMLGWGVPTLDSHYVFSFLYDLEGQLEQGWFQQRARR